MKGGVANMARVNTAPPAAPVLLTHEGARAYRITNERALRRSVLSCLLWEREFYDDGLAIAHRLAMLVGVVPPSIVAQIAIEAREVMHLRHVPLFLTRLLARGTPAARREVGPLLARIIQRPDELTEFLAMYWQDGKTPISKQVKIGLAQAFRKFNEYQLAKYDRETGIRLRDVMFMVHPKPRGQLETELFTKVANRTLATPDTWEVALSAGANKAQTFERLILENQLGALALLRNLRNMITSGVPEAVIRHGLLSAKVDRVLPFRFITAARYAPQFEPELEALMFRNLESAPRLRGKTVLLVDASGSMSVTLSAKSEVTRYDVAAGLAMLLREICENVVVMKFNDRATSVPPRRGFALRDALGRADGGTRTETAKAQADREGYDRVIIITDEQSSQPLTAPHGAGYVVNVASARNGIGYGPWIHIDGWSEAIVHYIQQYELAQFDA